MEEGSLLGQQQPEPNDTYNLAYMSYFLMGTGSLLPWNAFITAVDYFSRLYRHAHVDKVFSVVYMVPSLLVLASLFWRANRSRAPFRINLGLCLYPLSLMTVPIMDLVYVRGIRGLDVTVAAVGASGIVDALLEGSVIGSAENYLSGTCRLLWQEPLLQEVGIAFL